MDLSIVASAVNENILQAIEFAKKHGTTIEVVDCVGKANGDYVCDLTKFKLNQTYFHEYFFHLQFILLFINNYTHLYFTKSIHYDRNNCSFVSRNKEQCYVYKRNFHTVKIWHEDNVIMYCDMKAKSGDDGSTDLLPDENELNVYRKHFGIN
jgi:hypothetical protein